jgi:isocitrate dehydrogenase
VKKREKKHRNTTAYIPEHDHRLMVIIIQPSIIRMSPQVIQINRRINTSNQDLHFLLVEHPIRNTKRLASLKKKKQKTEIIIHTEATSDQSSATTLQKTHRSAA